MSALARLERFGEISIWSNFIFNSTDFVNRKYENPLGVNQNDINTGGTGVSGGYRGCYGEAHTKPIFRRDIV